MHKFVYHVHKEEEQLHLTAPHSLPCLWQIFHTETMLTTSQTDAGFHKRKGAELEGGMRGGCGGGVACACYEHEFGACDQKSTVQCLCEHPVKRCRHEKATTN